MSIYSFIKNELSGWGRFERIIFPTILLMITAISIYMNDSKIALVSAICGISYTILAGKGKISCYFIGLIGTICYSYLSLKNALYGNLALYALYYFPMQILGIFKWKKHLKKESGEIIKTQLPIKEKYLFLAGAIIATIIVSQLLTIAGDANPYIDSITTVFSIVGLILTVRRCIEQWHIWFIVNGLSTIMWIEAYINGSNCFATILMWATYFLLSIYFLHTWKKDLKENLC